MPEQQKRDLFNHTKETYDGSFTTDLLEQYKLYVQTAENVSTRRISSSRYLLTVNAALIASYGFQSASSGQMYWLILISVVGITVSLLSHSIIKSHRDLNAVKFKLIQKMERQLPVALYGYEWQLAECGQGRAYRRVSHIELWIPRILFSLHVVALIFIVIFIICGIPDWAK